jgi:predicted trehalose synthase
MWRQRAREEVVGDLKKKEHYLPARVAELHATLADRNGNNFTRHIEFGCCCFDCLRGGS